MARPPVATPIKAWPREDLVRRLSETLDVAMKALPILTASSYQGDSDGLKFLERQKFVDETALLLYAVTRVAPDPELQERVRALAEALAPFARDDWALSWIRSRPAFAAEISLGHLCLTKMGFPCVEFDTQLKAATGTSDVGLPERVAWKDIEAIWQQGLGASVPELDFETALARTAVSQRQDALFATRKEVYAVTHGLVYATDFGHRHIRIPRGHAEMLDDAGSALARCLDEDDFDLASEVLWSWPCLRAPWSAAATFAFSVMVRVSDEIGIIPSMSLRHNEFAELPTPEARASYFYRESYHAVYVLGLLLAATLLPGAAPPAAPLRNMDDRAAMAARQLATLLLATNSQPQWHTQFAELEPSQQAALIPLIVDVGVRRAVKAADFDRLREVLTVFLAADVGAPTAAVAQGVDLIQRLAAGCRT